MVSTVNILFMRCAYLMMSRGKIKLKLYIQGGKKWKFLVENPITFSLLFLVKTDHSRYKNNKLTLTCSTSHHLVSLGTHTWEFPRFINTLILTQVAWCSAFINVCWIREEQGHRVEKLHWWFVLGDIRE